MDQATSTSGDPGSASSLSRLNGRPKSLYAQAKSYMKRETISFFGLNENIEGSQQEKWIERRKRLAVRKYGALKDEIPPPRTVKDSFARSYQQSRETYGSRPDVLPDERDESDAIPGAYELPVRKKPSVIQMTFNGIAYLVTTLTRHRPRTPQRSRQWSRSYLPSEIPLGSQSFRESSSLDNNEVFFGGAPASGEASEAGQEAVDGGAGGDFSPSDQVVVHPTREAQIPQPGAGTRTPSWRRGRDSPGTAGPEVGSSRIDSNFLGRAFDNSNRRQYGMGVVGRFFGRKMKKSVRNEVHVKEQLDDLDDYRPFFTYWVTTVQVIVLIISLFSYGFGPAGIDLNRRSGLVLVTSLSLQQVDYLEPANFWLGPRAADLIHLGAKYSPCMRRDTRIIKEMEKWREKERDTACCIRNDDSGCVQSSHADCSKAISTWKKWSPSEKGPGGRISGSVCGLDPKFCEAPASIAPHEWPDDITKWPICRKPQRYRQKDRSGKVATAEHMACEVIGHPCCIGIHGTCSITTKEYCDFVKGHFHEEASLCSQVSCLDDVCGMISFYVPDHPDQFYRLWTSLFLHAGIVHMAVTLLIQLSLMRDLEKLTGPLRIGIIYIGSGVAGNLASAIFVPYRAEVGPAGSQFGLLACLVVEVLNVWPMLQKPENALMKLLGIVLILFLFGLLPWIDNYAHFFGFVFGFLLSYAFLPFVSFGPYDRAKKITLIWICLFSAGIIFGSLIVLFYIVPVYECQICNYFNCVPLTKDFCAEQNINFIKNPNLGDV
ncbi:UNVERIFIED_CONTAM: hypothetical protein PYX00_000884 [Menopon gallinae]|uniref:Peptidase S54 rhomboid domain-containing protein n=1 Tax=Menopon gallinae TaxID=328185 RepID=A0AAW2IC09_9NEOP